MFDSFLSDRSGAEGGIEDDRGAIERRCCYRLPNDCILHSRKLTWTQVEWYPGRLFSWFSGSIVSFQRVTACAKDFCLHVFWVTIQKAKVVMD